MIQHTVSTTILLIPLTSFYATLVVHPTLNCRVTLPRYTLPSDGFVALGTMAISLLSSSSIVIISSSSQLCGDIVRGRRGVKLDLKLKPWEGFDGDFKTVFDAHVRVEMLDYFTILHIHISAQSFTFTSFRLPSVEVKEGEITIVMANFVNILWLNK